MKTTLPLIAAAILCGCVASSKRLSNVELGMSREQVVRILGEPKSVSARDGSQFLRYQLSGTDAPPLLSTDRRFADGYTVQMVDGRVVAFGRDDEFQPIRVQVSQGSSR